MKRGVIDTLRRGLDNLIVNWPLILIRFGEAVVFGILSIVTAIAIIIPTVVSIGFHISDFEKPENMADALALLLRSWLVLVWIGLAVFVLLLVFVLIHSFVEAGCARVYVDGERAAGRGMDGPRSRFRVFSMERWMAGATSGWWTLFWIYNLAWGFAGLLMLIPLLPTAILVLLMRDSPGPAIAVGCLGLFVSFFFILIVTVVTGMWSTRAIAEWAVGRGGASASLSAAWQAVRGDLGRHLLIALAIFVVAMAGSAFFASFSLFASFGAALRHAGSFNLITMPLRMVGTLLNSLFSSAVSAWYLASYSGLASEGHSKGH